MNSFLSVLVIGTPPDLTERSRQELRSEAYRVVSEQPTSLDEALVSLRAAAYGLVIVDDSTLPFSVIDLQLALQQQTIDIPVLALVHAHNTATQSSWLAAGVADILRIDQLERLPLTVKRILRDHATHREHGMFRQLFINNPMPMWIYDVNTLMFLEVNDTATIKYGYSRDEFLRMTIKDIRPTEDLDRLMKSLEKPVDSLREHDRSWRHRLKDGTVIEVEITSHSILFEGNNAVLVMANNITQRRLIEAEALQREQEFRQLFADNPLPMYIYERQTLRFLEVNDATVAKYGYSRDAFLTMTLKDIRPAEEVSRLIGTFTDDRPALSLYDKTWKHRLKDGTVIEVDIADHDISFGGKAAGLVVAIDVTERKRAERALRESEHQFKTLIEHAPEAILILDRNGTYTQVNQRACDLFGYTQEQFLGMHSSELLLPEDMSASTMRINTLLAGHTLISERRLVRKDGSVVDTIVSARALDENRILALIQDISDLKRTEEALIASEQRYRAIIESQSEMVIRWLPDGSLSFANDAYYNFLRLVRDDSIQKNIFAYVHPDDKAGLITLCIGLRQENPSASHENRLIRTDGEVRWTQWSNRAIFDIEGTLVEIQSVGHDITARRQAEEQSAFLFHLLDVTNAASGQESALNATLQLICEHQHWAYGEVWLPTPDGTALVAGAPHYIAPASSEVIRPLRTVTESSQLPKGKGGAGRVFASKAIEWVDDLSQVSVNDYPRKSLIEAAGLYTTISVPVVVQDEVIAVVQFVTTGKVKQNEREVALLTAAVNQLGTVILRKRANDKLRADEERYRSLLQSFDSIILMLDTDGHISFANEVGWQRFGISTAARAGTTLLDVFPSEDAKQLMTYCQQVAQTGRGFTEERRTTIGNRLVWLHMSYQPVHNGTPAIVHILINASDISQLKYAEMSLERAATRLQILHSIDSSILRAQTAEEIAESALTHIQRLIPYERAAVTMINTDEMVGNYLAMRGFALTSIAANFGTPMQFSSNVKRVLQQRFVLMSSSEDARQWGVEYEKVFLSSTRTLLLVSIRLNETLTAMMGLHATITDAFTGEHIEIALEVADQLAIAFTQSHLNEQIQAYAADLEKRVEVRTAEVAQAKTRIETILNTSGDGIVVVNEDRIIQQLNPAIDALFAASGEMYIGQALRVLVHPADNGNLEAAIAAANRDETMQIVEVRAVRQDNTLFDAEIGIASTKRLNGDRPTYVCTLRNVSARKRTEELLRQALQQEKDLSELKTRFISMASHEFRTPLATIRAATDTLSAYRVKMTEDQVDARLVKIQNQVAHLTDIMDEVLTVARIQANRVAFSPVDTDLDAFCHEIIDEFLAHPDLNHLINYACDLQTMVVPLDRMLMRKIISNLLGNAIKYSPKGSRIDISLNLQTTSFVLRIEDHGIGIPDADQVHLFEAFHRASNVGMIPGTGLGLTIVKQAVELHGGTLTFRSQVGSGTAFVVTIPLASSVKRIDV